MKKHVQQQTTYSNPAVEAHLQGFARECKALCIKGRQDGQQNLPMIEDYWRAKVVSQIITKGRNCLHTIQQILQPVSTVTTMNAEAKQVSDAVATMEVQANDMEIRIHTKEQGIQHKSSLLKRKYIAQLVVALTCIAGIGDGLLCYDSFMQGGISYLQAIFYAALITLLVPAGSHFGSNWTMQTEHKPQKQLRFIAVALISALVFLLIGIIRVGMLAEQVPDISYVTNYAPEDTGNVSGLLIATLSWVIFMSAYFFSLLTYRSPAERSACTQLEEDMKELEQLRNTYRECIAERDQLLETHKQNRELVVHKCEYALTCKKRIESLVDDGLRGYIEANLNHRSDGLCPEFFVTVPETHF